MSIRDDLIAAKAIIDTPDKWCKGTMRDGHGSYCAVGACMEVNPSHCGTILQAIYESAAVGTRKLTVYNDLPTTTHADILAVFDRAIEAAS